MPWTDTARAQHSRATGRYPSDMTDREWALVAPLLPGPKPGGRPRTVDLREVMNAILYLASSGCQWRALPKDFPPMTTVQGYFYAWRDMGLFGAINRVLVVGARELEGREASPTAGVIDSQSVKTTGHLDFRPFLRSSGTTDCTTQCGEGHLTALCPPDFAILCSSASAFPAISADRLDHQRDGHAGHGLMRRSCTRRRML